MLEEGKEHPKIEKEPEAWRPENGGRRVRMTKLKIFLGGNLKQSRSEKLIVVDNANRQVCTVRVKILDDGRIGWWTLLRNFRRSLDNSSPIDGVYV
ncbi:MAG: hypothetical protein QW808_01510, partial [Desulfurococcaceae archaeon]